MVNPALLDPGRAVEVRLKNGTWAPATFKAAMPSGRLWLKHDTFGMEWFAPPEEVRFPGADA